ncbi:MAG: hypothetical protein Q7U97_14530 [Rhodocyclaceae bacterium]|nr:hypothetical protein [Rhodocyclaceae bacterium]
MKKTKKLSIRLEAQAIVIGHLLDAALSNRRMDGEQVMADIDAFVAAPKSPGLSPKRIARLGDELDSWCEVIYARVAADRTMRPERTRRKKVARETP